MIRLVRDPDEVANAYLEGLNLCFGGWGDTRRFDWCFRRRAGGPPADLFVAEEAGRLVAGSANTYRTSQRPGHAPELIGCMTASWTVHTARGRGLFRRMIERSRAQARRRGCSLLIAFAGAGKASRPGLLEAGAHTVEGAFLTSPGGAADGAVEAAPPSVEETMAAFAGRAIEDGAAKLIYESSEWRGQMLERPHPVERWRLGDGAVALVEPAGEVGRLLDVSTGGGEAFVGAALQAAASIHATGRRMSAYSLDPAVIAALTALGFTVSRAWLYLMATEDEPVDRCPWWFANGDRM